MCANQGGEGGRTGARKPGHQQEGGTAKGAQTRTGVGSAHTNQRSSKREDPTTRTRVTNDEEGEDDEESEDDEEGEDEDDKRGQG